MPTDDRGIQCESCPTMADSEDRETAQAFLDEAESILGDDDGNSPLQRWFRRHPEHASDALRIYSPESDCCFDDHGWTPHQEYIPWPHYTRECEEVTRHVNRTRLVEIARRNRSRGNRSRNSEGPVLRANRRIRWPDTLPMTDPRRQNDIDRYDERCHGPDRRSRD